MPKREWNDVPDDAFKMSQSTIGSLELSPCRVTTLPEEVKLVPSVNMFRGTVVHAILEDIENQAIDPKRAVLPRHIIEVSQELAFDEGWQFEGIVSDELTFVTDVSMISKAWLTSDVRAMIHEEGWITVEAEVPHAKKVTTLPNGQDFYFVTGGIDRIYSTDQGYVGIDFKTSARPWSKKDGTGLIQDDAYAWLVLDEYGLIQDWRFLVGSFSNMQWNVHPTAVDRASIEAFLTRAIGWAEFLTMENRPHLCTPVSMKQRGWWARPAYNHGYCPTCRHVGDEWDNHEAWEDTPGAQSS